MKKLNQEQLKQLNEIDMKINESTRFIQDTIEYKEGHADAISTVENRYIDKDFDSIDHTRAETDAKYAAGLVSGYTDAIYALFVEGN